MLRNKKQKYRKPTREEMLALRPKRADFHWTVNTKGLVEITVPKFNRKAGVVLCKILKKQNIFIAHMDILGSAIWKQCDGKQTVHQILSILEKEFPKENDIDTRLFYFIQQMAMLHYLDLS
ncbi:MAG: PqqD family protein [Thermoplasmatota archaeon]